MRKQQEATVLDQGEKGCQIQITGAEPTMMVEIHRITSEAYHHEETASCESVSLSGSNPEYGEKKQGAPIRLEMAIFIEGWCVSLIERKTAQALWILLKDPLQVRIQFPWKAFVNELWPQCQQEFSFIRPCSL